MSHLTKKQEGFLNKIFDPEKNKTLRFTYIQQEAMSKIDIQFGFTNSRKPGDISIYDYLINFTQTTHAMFMGQSMDDKLFIAERRIFLLFNFLTAVYMPEHVITISRQKFSNFISMLYSHMRTEEHFFTTLLKKIQALTAYHYDETEYVKYMSKRIAYPELIRLSGYQQIQLAHGRTLLIKYIPTFQHNFETLFYQSTRGLLQFTLIDAPNIKDVLSIFDSSAEKLRQSTQKIINEYTEKDLVFKKPNIYPAIAIMIIISSLLGLYALSMALLNLCLMAGGIYYYAQNKQPIEQISLRTMKLKQFLDQNSSNSHQQSRRKKPEQRTSIQINELKLVRQLIALYQQYQDNYPLVPEILLSSQTNPTKKRKKTTSSSARTPAEKNAYLNPHHGGSDLYRRLRKRTAGKNLRHMVQSLQQEPVTKTQDTHTILPAPEITRTSDAIKLTITGSNNRCARYIIKGLDTLRTNDRDTLCASLQSHAIFARPKGQSGFKYDRHRRAEKYRDKGSNRYQLFFQLQANGKTEQSEDAPSVPTYVCTLKGTIPTK